MTKEEAQNLFELTVGADESNIREVYEQKFSELQMSIANAPTDGLRLLYQQELEKIEAAKNVLIKDDELNNLPSVKPENFSNAQSDQNKHANANDGGIFN